MNSVDVLTAARDIVAKPNGWTQGSLARDANGLPAATRSTRATCFCIEGAICRAAGTFDQSWHLAHAAIREIADSPAEFNDAPGRTQAEVVRFFDLAIEDEQFRIAERLAA